MFKKVSKDIKQLAKIAVLAAEDKKAKDVLTLDISNLSTIADFFIVCSASNPIQAQAIANNIEEKMSEEGLALLRKEGYNNANWILLDYGDIVAHIFQEEDRWFYNLEQLWGDAPAV